MSLTDLIHRVWRRLSESAREHVLETRAEQEGWWADDGHCAVQYAAMNSGLQAAKEFVATGDWGDDDDTSRWVRVFAWPRYVLGGVALDTRHIARDSREMDSHLVEIEPPEPPCMEGSDGHKWREYGPWGHGGGVIYRDVCRRCGCARTTDTWAQDRESGRQGLTSVSYERGYEATDWEHIDDRCRAISPEHLGADATEEEVEAYCDLLRRVAPEYASRDEWERLEREVLDGVHGQWVRTAATAAA